MTPVVVEVVDPELDLDELDTGEVTPWREMLSPSERCALDLGSASLRDVHAAGRLASENAHRATLDLFGSDAELLDRLGRPPRLVESVARYHAARSDVRLRWLRECRRLAAEVLRRRRENLTEVVSSGVLDALDELAAALSRVTLDRLVDTTHTPPPTVTVALWSAPTLAPPPLALLRHRWEPTT